MKIFFFLIGFVIGFSCMAETLVIQTSLKEVVFKTDIADTPVKQEKGLMFKESIPDDYAMTFLFDTEKIAHMWMKNTLIPLDMIFFDEKGFIVHTYKNVPAHSLKILSSIFQVKGVVELNAGLIDKNGIKIGDRLYVK